MKGRDRRQFIDVGVPQTPQSGKVVGQTLPPLRAHAFQFEALQSGENVGPLKTESDEVTIRDVVPVAGEGGEKAVPMVVTPAVNMTSDEVLQLRVQLVDSRMVRHPSLSGWL